jgi:large subunit GTPase 1
VKMRSVTEQPALDEFLSTAELAGTDFTAEKMNNVKIIHTSQRNPYLLSAGEEQSAVRKHKANQNRLTVPRRPPWDETTTATELDRREKEMLLEWRRGLAELQETNDLLMTPFERNIEVWRQLWRVIERSDLVVQIVDARNPLMFRSEDLERYVKEVDSQKNNLLLVNKADMLTEGQREVWAAYFEENDISYRYFSAALAKEMNEAGELSDPAESEGDFLEEDVMAGEAGVVGNGPITGAEKPDLQRSRKEESPQASEDELDIEDHTTGLDARDDQRTRILTIDELESLFLEHAPEVESRLCSFLLLISHI